MDRWSLDALYKGYEDKNYIEDMKELIHMLDLAEEGQRTGFLDKKTGETLEEILKRLERIQDLFERLYNFASLRQAADTQDEETAIQVDRLMQQYGRLNKLEALYTRYIGEFDELPILIESTPLLKKYEYFLLNAKKDAVYVLSDDAEEVFSKMSLSGGDAWSSMRDYLTSTMEVEYGEEQMTLSDIRNLAYSPDAEVRKAAYEAELNAYEKVKDAISYALNSIKQQVNSECELRGYESALDKTLKQSRMQRETLDAMLAEIESYMPKFREYLKQKAAILGHKNGLPFYDLFAPLGNSQRRFTAEEAGDYLVNHFKEFSPDMADMMRQAFDENWIDFYPRKGKVGGAFCCNLPMLKQSRILTNFDGTFNSVLTLAHELGHAYHGMHIQEHAPLNWEYSMPVAETASNFNEIFLTDAAIKETDEKEKLILIEGQLQDLTQIMIDIYSRYLFETAVFEERKNGFMFSTKLEQIMLDAQDKTYGDGLDLSYRHPFMWINKGHYYSSSLSFYNFPYAFGGLFARGLFAKYKQEGSTFVGKYQKLLYATTVNDVEEVAKIAGIDLSGREFWHDGLENIRELIDDFLRLSEKQK